MTSLRVGASSSASSCVAVRLAGVLDHVGDVVGLEQAHPLPALTGAEVEERARPGRPAAGRRRTPRRPRAAARAGRRRAPRDRAAATRRAARRSESCSSSGTAGAASSLRQRRQRTARSPRVARSRATSTSSKTSESSPRLSATARISAATLLCLLGRQRRDLARCIGGPVDDGLGHVLVGRGHRSHRARSAQDGEDCGVRAKCLDGSAVGIWRALEY